VLSDDVDETLRVAREALKLSADALENAARIARDRPAPLPPPRVHLPLPPRGRSSSGRPADPARTGTVSSAGPPPRESPRLVVGVPTAPRAGDVDYLTRTLETLLRELPDPAAAEDPPGSPGAPFGGVRVIVMNTKPGRHVVFSRVRARFEGWSKEGEREAAEAGSNPGEREAAEASAEAEAEARLRRVAAASVSFVDSPGTFGDPTPNRPDPDDLDNPTNVPGAAVRRQTADLATLLALAADVASAAEASSSPSSSSSYFLFLEDDFATCPGMLAAVRYLLAKSTAAYPEWLGVRFSYGMNGVVVRVRDAPPFARYLASHVSRLPADLLWREWTEGRREDVRRTTAGRGVVVYRYNLMEHVGEVSTFAVRPERPRWPRCYEPMSSVWSLGRAETFDEKRCAESDVSPCGRSRGVDLEKWRGGSPGEDQFPWLKHAEDRP